MEHKEQHLLDLLKKIAAEQGYQNYELITNDLSSGGANYMSQLYTAIIREQYKDDLHLFAKTAFIPENLRNLMIRNVFTIENYVYTKLAKTFEALEEERGVPEFHRLKFTKYFGYYDGKHEEVLVLENLMAHGYSPFDRLQSIDWEYSASAVSELAKFHALSLAYSEIYPEEYKEILETLRFEVPKDGLEKMATGSFKLALDNVQPENKVLFENFRNTIMSNIDMFPPKPSFRSVIIHGDFRGSNLLHRVLSVSCYKLLFQRT